jgi:hypothetical protein
MDAALFAIVYLIFALMYVMVNLNALSITTTSEMYEAVAFKFERMPFSFEPLKYIDQIQTPSDIYAWLKEVFVPVFYSEMPQDGSDQYCSKRYPCRIFEGDCDVDEQCVGIPGQCRDKTVAYEGVMVNGRYWDKADLEAWCESAGTPVDLGTITTKLAYEVAPGEEPGNYAIQPCKDHDWMECCNDPYTRKEIEQVKFIDYGTMAAGRNCPPQQDADGDCCDVNIQVPWNTFAPPDHREGLKAEEPHPEQVTWNGTKTLGQAAAWIDKEHADNSELRPLTIGGFNRVLVARLSLKRYQLEENASPRFKDRVPYKLMGTGSTINAGNYYGSLEDTSTFTGPWTPDVPYEYAMPQSNPGAYQNAGAYVKYLDPDWSKEKFDKELTWLYMNNWFDMRMASLVVEMMMFNGNVDQFLQVGWIFDFDFAGLCSRYTVAQAFNLSLYQWEKMRLFMELGWFVIVGFVIWFISLEFVKMCDFGLAVYTSKPSSWVDITSLLLCLITIFLQMGQFLSPTFTRQIFDADKWSGPDGWQYKQELYTELEDMGNMVRQTNYVVAFSLLIVFVRSVMLLTELAPNYGLMLSTMGAALANLIFFSLMFFIMFMGFTLFAFFTFGPGYGNCKELTLTILECFSMLLGISNYNELGVADAVMSPIFFYLFYVFFLFVLLNMFISILLSAYDQEDNKITPGGGVNPLMTLFNLVMTKIVKPILKLLKLLLGPLLEALGSVIQEAKKASARPKRKRTDSESQPEKTPSKKTEVEDKESPISGECALMIFFMANFMLLVNFQGRGTESFFLQQATLKPTKDAQWLDYPPLRLMDFDQVTSLSDVADWSRTAILDLYSDSMCATTDGRSIPVDQCDNSKDKQQLVPRINTWNIGFQNTTFVRVTIQHACFYENDAPRWVNGYKYLRQSYGGACAHQSCAKINEGLAECISFDGNKVDVDNFPVLGGADPSLGNYNYSISGEATLGSYKQLGGFVVSLGTTREQAEYALEMLTSDNWFSQNSASIVFDWLTYNGNIDMFTYNEVAFSLESTGKISSAARAQSLPLNFEVPLPKLVSEDGPGGGWYSTYRFLVFLLMFFIYIPLVIYYVIRQLLDIVKFQATGSGGLGFIIDYYKDDLFNVSDMISLTLSILTVTSLVFNFLQIPFRGEFSFSLEFLQRYGNRIPISDENLVGKKADPTRFQMEDWYIFLQFEWLAGAYSTFLTFAALNSFFISIKVLKYVNRIPVVKVFSGALATAAPRIIAFTMVILLLLVGFALLFHVQFGVVVPSFGSPLKAVFTLFVYMLGVFDLAPLIKADMLSIPFFIVFMMLFYFIFINMYLATMMTKYSKTVGEIEVKRVEEEIERNTVLVEVEYDTPEKVAEDIKIWKNRDTEEVFVREVTDGGPAAEKGILPSQVDKEPRVLGHKIVKIGLDSVEFRQKQDHEILADIEQPEKGKVKIVFKDPPKQRSGIWKMMEKAGMLPAKDEGGDGGLRPTVRGFWRAHGAVTWTYRHISEVIDKEGASDSGEDDVSDDEDDQAEGEDEEEDEGKNQDEGKKDRAEDKIKQDQQIRTRTKKKLDALLFSRWSDGRRGHGAEDLEAVAARIAGTGEGGDDLANVEGGSGPTEADHNTEELKDFLQGCPVTGEEAWLDVFMTSIERELFDEGSIIAELLRTSDMRDPGGTGKPAEMQRQKVLRKFNLYADRILRILEMKAKARYYRELQRESDARKELLQTQNGVLYEYATELESKFEEVMSKIHTLKQRKKIMITQLAGTLSREDYAHLDREFREAQAAADNGAYVNGENGFH